MLDVVTFKWSTPGYRSEFTGDHVNTLAAMVRRNYHKPVRVTCITDDPRGINPNVRVLPLWGDHAHLKSPHGGNNPACYRRLKLWSAEAKELIGERILCIDLDMVLVGDCTPLWDRPEDVVLWKDNLNPTTPYNGAMQLIRAGSRPHVWNDFNPDTSPKKARAAGFFGSDQAWLCYALGPGEARWGTEHGAYSWRVHLRQTPPGQAHIPFRPGVDCVSKLPANAKCVNFHGIDEPAKVAPFVPWVAENYQ